MSPSADKRFQSKEILLFSAVAKSMTLGKTAVFTAVFSLVLFAYAVSLSFSVEDGTLIFYRRVLVSF